MALSCAPFPAIGGSATVSEAVPLYTPQRLPDLRDESQTNFSPMQERKLGETIVRQLRASGGYINDPEVNDYLNELGHRLPAPAAPGRPGIVSLCVAHNTPQRAPSHR